MRATCSARDTRAAAHTHAVARRAACRRNAVCSLANRVCADPTRVPGGWGGGGGKQTRKAAGMLDPVHQTDGAVRSNTNALLNLICRVPAATAGATAEQTAAAAAHQRPLPPPLALQATAVPAATGSEVLPALDLKRRTRHAAADAQAATAAAKAAADAQPALKPAKASTACRACNCAPYSKELMPPLYCDMNNGKSNPGRCCAGCELRDEGKTCVSEFEVSRAGDRMAACPHTPL